MEKLNSKGFTAIIGLLLVIIISVIGGTGYYVYNAQQKTKESLNATAKSQGSVQKSGKKTVSTTTEKKPTSATRTNTSRQTVAYETAKFSFDLPIDWSFSGAPSHMGLDEYIGNVVSPDKKLQLSIYIQKISDYKGSSVSNGPYQDSFAGIGGKTYYLEENSTSANTVNQLGVSACGPNACKTLDDHTTKLNDTYWLNLAIDPGSMAISPYKLSINDPLVAQIKAIISSITL